ncbi:MAG: hypothetical protein RIA69_01370 [Cyclobacteriaceae bacterium]
MKLFTLLLLFNSFQITPEFDLKSGNDSSSKTGYVIIENDSLTGQIKINLKHDRVMVSKDNINKIITARYLKRVVVDGQNYVGGRIGENYYLFEEIIKLSSSLIYREGIKLHALDQQSIGPWFVLEKGEIRTIEKSNKLLEVFEADAKWMKQHMKFTDLDPTKKEDMIKAFEYYQSTTF